MASKTVGALNVSIGANAKAFQKGLSNARKKLSSFRGKVMGATKKIAKFGAAAGTAGVAAAGAIGAFAVKQGQAMAETQRTAEAIGVETKELSKLKYAAKQSGVETDTLTEGMKEMQLRLQEAAATGSGPAADALDKMGLNAQELSEMEPDKAFRKVSQAIKESPNMDKFAADGIFGGDGQKMLNMLKKGEDGLNKMGKEAEKTGEAVGNKAGKQAVAFNKAWNQLKSSIMGGGNDIFNAIAPMMTKTMKIVTSLIPTVKSAVSRIFKVTKQWLTPLFNAYQNTFSSVLQSTIRVMQSIWGVFEGIGVAIYNLWVSIFGKTSKNASGFFTQLLKAGNKLKKGISFSLNAIEFGLKNFGDVSKLALLTSAHWLVKVANQYVYYFTKVLPASIKAFVENPIKYLKEGGKAIFTTYKRVFGNIGRIVSMLPSILSGSVSISEITKPVMEGMDKFKEDVLEVPDRKKGELEKSLGKEVDAIQDNVGRKFGEFMDKKRKEPKETTENVKSGFDGILDTKESESDDTGKETGNNIAEQMKKKGKDVGSEVSKGMSEKAPELIKAGSAQAKAMSFSGGMQRKTQQKQLKAEENTSKNTEKMVKILKQQQGLGLEQFSLS